MSYRRTKIIATLGPATTGESQIDGLLEAGADAVRLNFSHGSHEKYARLLALVRAASVKAGKPLAVIADLQGPKIRVGEMPAAGLKLVRGQQVTLTARRQAGGSGLIPVSYGQLAQVVRKGSRILLNDGKIALRALSAEGSDIVCRVTTGGLLKSRQGVNFPGVSIPAPSLTVKDRQDLEFALQAGVDYIALSFVRSADDVKELRGLIGKLTKGLVRIIAKIERREAIRNIDAIIAAADAVMIARGDLGVEIAGERVPYWQKEIIRRSSRQAKIVITATQMLESMISSPTPTRAEASDVANAVYDGTDAVMLSGETAIGKFPSRAVAAMNRIARTVESSLPAGGFGLRITSDGVTRAISAAAVGLAADLGAAAIVTPTSSGSTALEVAKHRPYQPVVAVSPSIEVINQLALAWGVKPQLISPARDTDDMFSKAIAAAQASSIDVEGKMIVITAGVRVNVSGTTNLIKVHLLD